MLDALKCDPSGRWLPRGAIHERDRFRDIAGSDLRGRFVAADVRNDTRRDLMIVAFALRVGLDLRPEDGGNGDNFGPDFSCLSFALSAEVCCVRSNSRARAAVVKD